MSFITRYTIPSSTVIWPMHKVFPICVWHESSNERASSVSNYIYKIY